MCKLFRIAIQVLKNEGIKTFLIKSMKFPYNTTSAWVRLFIYKKILQKINEIQNFSSGDPVEIFEFAWNFDRGLIRPLQIKEEFVELLKLLKTQNPKYILEIGTANGGSLFCFCKLANEEATIISIDLPGGPFGGGYPEWKTSLYQTFTKKNQKLYLLRDDSHKRETLEKVKQILNDKKLDFLFIDGDHSYEGVKKDFEMYGPLVKNGGIIAFHDICRGPRENVGEVPKFWEDIKKELITKELIKDPNQSGLGIGVVFKP